MRRWREDLVQSTSRPFLDRTRAKNSDKPQARTRWFEKLAGRRDCQNTEEPLPPGHSVQREFRAEPRLEPCRHWRDNRAHKQRTEEQKTTLRKPQLSGR